MQVPGVAADGGATAAEGPVVMVAVKLDCASKELLTWALVKVAQPGDRVVALHVLDESSSVTEGASSLVSIVNAFDSMVAVYQGFCNLKQVDLKLKVCRGRSARTALVREVNSYLAAKLIVGVSKTEHRAQPSASLAKFCAKRLSKSFSVFAVDNGKVVFQKNVTKASIAEDSDKRKSYVRLLQFSLSRNLKLQRNCNPANGNCSHKSHSCCGSNKTSENSISKTDKLSPETKEDGDDVDNSLALVPFQAIEDDQSSKSITVSKVHGLRPGWSFLKRVFLPMREHQEKVAGKKISAVQRIFQLPSNQSSAVVYPDQKQSKSFQSEDHTTDMDGETGAIVPVGSEAASPLSFDDVTNSVPKELEGFHDKYSSTCRLFSFEELQAATSNFTPDNLIGNGGSSQVYLGRLSDGKELAVKILKPSYDVLKEFASEVDIVTSLHHNNIVSLIGFCYEHHNLALVYDLLNRGSLEENLHGDKKDPSTFGWQERYRVAVGVAEALDYIHNDPAQPVIHKDVKSSNILLADDFEPQLSDFGLANQVADVSSQTTSDGVAGTFGYLAPEYLMYGKVSDKIDVYAFGVVILELLSGRKPIGGDYPKGQESLVMWAKPILESEDITQLLDPTLSSESNEEHIARMVLAATLCISRSAQVRPPINLVLKLLRGDEEAMNWGRQQMALSQELDTVDGEDYSLPISIESHLNLALQDLVDDPMSDSSTEQGISLDDYMSGRWSRSSSFD